jgi:hypothetical protein
MGSHMPFTAKASIMIGGWSNYVPAAHVVVRSCRRFETHRSLSYRQHLTLFLLNLGLIHPVALVL